MANMPRRVILESPFAATEYRTREQHRRYLLLALRDCIKRGESPFASHAYFPEILDDDDILDRAIGIKCGWAWGDQADAVVAYGDLGISPGMYESIRHYMRAGIPIEWRKLPQGIAEFI